MESVLVLPFRLRSPNLLMSEGMPKDRRPTRYRVVGGAPPAAFLPRLLYPFRSPHPNGVATIETA